MILTIIICLCAAAIVYIAESKWEPTNNKEISMQACRMNGDLFERKDDGRLFLNGKEIIKHAVKMRVNVEIGLLSFAAGMALVLFILWPGGV